MLCLYSKLPEQSSVGILIVDEHVEDGQRLADTMTHSQSYQKTHLNYGFSVHATAFVPSDVESRTLPHYDCIVFISQGSKNSVRSLEMLAKHVDVLYFHNRCCMVVSTGTNSAMINRDQQSVVSLARSYNMPVFFANLTDAEEKQHLADKLFNFGANCAGMRGVTPLMIDSVRRRYATSVNTGVSLSTSTMML